MATSWLVSEEPAPNGLLDGLKILAQNVEAKDRAERLEVGQAPVIFDTADSPACTDCGSIMVRNGSATSASTAARRRAALESPSL